MADQFAQVYLQLVFAVKYRGRLLRKPWREELFSYMGGIINQYGHKSYIVNGVEDHVHILLSLNPSKSVSDLVRELKRSSSTWINGQKLVKGFFQWQEGYGVFSYAKSQVPNVYKYIQNQESHHARKSFQEEFIGILKRLEIEYDEKFLFDFFDSLKPEL